MHKNPPAESPTERNFDYSPRLPWPTWDLNCSSALCGARSSCSHSFSRKETSERFPRIASYIVAGTALCTAYLLRFDHENVFEIPHDPRFWGLIALVVGSFLYSHTHQRFTRTCGFLLYVFSAVGMVYDQPVLGIVNFLTGSLVLGSVFAGQYLGHWFLTVPGLHIGELKKVVRFLFISLGLKTFEIIASLSLRDWITYNNIDIFGRPLALDVSQTKNLMQLNLNATFFSLDGDLGFGFGLFGMIVFLTRILWGIVAPFILAIMIKKTVDMRSTQSATGILYALCVMIIVGEGAALYLKIMMGLYF